MFSSIGYLLSKEEGQPGTPEKPLSDLGRVSYQAYWKSIVLEYLHARRESAVNLVEISRETGIHCQDIMVAFQLLDFIHVEFDSEADSSVKTKFTIDWKRVDDHFEKVTANL